MNCKQAEELLPLYAGRDLDDKRATLVTEHLQTCAACTRVADEYRESFQLTEQFAPPIFSETVYAGIRQRVLREIETEAMSPAWSQTIASLFRPRLTWAIAGVLLIVVSMFAIYFMVNRRKDEPQLADKLPAKVEPERKEGVNSGLQASGAQGNEQADHPSSVNTGVRKQLTADPRPRQKRSRDTLADPTSTGALVETIRMEIQTKDPKIRIIWFVQQETKPVIPNSKGI